MAKKPVIKKAKKDNSLRNAVITFGAAMCLYASIVPGGISSLSDLIIGGLVSLLASFIIKLATTPMKGLEAPSTSAGVIAENVKDELAQSVVLKGLETLDALQKERLAINEYDFTRRLQELHSAYRELLNQVLADNSKAPRMTELNSYYMPTLLTLLRSYRTAKSQGTSYMDISATRKDLAKTLDQLIQATRNLKRKMVQVDLDATRIKMDVLFNNLQASGLIVNKDADGLHAVAAEAAAAMSLGEQLSSPARAEQAAPQPAPVRQAVPVMRSTPAPTPVQAPAPVPKPTARPAAEPVKPAVVMDAVQPAAQPKEDTPVLQVSMPTASAQQLSQGAPVLYVPGLLDKDEPDDDKQSTIML